MRALAIDGNIPVLKMAPVPSLEWCGKVEKFEDIVGLRVAMVRGLEIGSEEIELVTDHGPFRMNHDQACCESVDLAELDGSAEDLVGQVILAASQENDQSNGAYKEFGDHEGSSTWTFFRITTIKGTVVMRWFGTSNGYYSETPNMYWRNEKCL